MKNILLQIIVIVSIVSSVLAQDYIPVSTKSINHYSGVNSYFNDEFIKGDVLFSSLIRNSIDLGEDSVMYYIPQASDLICSRIHFFGDSILWVKSEDKFKLFIENGKSLLFYPNESRNVKWEFFSDAERTYFAEIAEVNYVDFGAFKDSVQTLLITTSDSVDCNQYNTCLNNKTIKISMNHGIVEAFELCYFPKKDSPLKLEGVDSLFNGLKLTKDIQVPNYSKGQVYHYAEERGQRPFSGPSNETIIDTKHRILNVNFRNDTLIVEKEVVTDACYYYAGNKVNCWTSEFVYNEEYYIPNNITPSLVLPEIVDNIAQDNVYLFYKNKNGLGLFIYRELWGGNEVYKNDENKICSGELIDGCYGPASYTENLGLTISKCNGGFGSFFDVWLLDVDIDSTIFTGTPEVLTTTNSHQIQVFPTITTHGFKIQVEDTLHQLFILNTLGELVHEIQLSKNQDYVDVSTLKSGLYILKFIGDSGIFVSHIQKL